MTNLDPQAVGLADLETALDTYGADRTRWPAPVRHALSGLIAGNEDAQKMLAAAELFDRLLDRAPTLDASRLDALTDRIVAAAERQPRIIASGAGTTAGTVLSKRRDINRSWMRERGWAGAALAASLMIGIMAGQSKVIDPAAQLLIGSDTSGTSVSQLAQVDDADGILDEDLL